MKMKHMKAEVAYRELPFCAETPNDEFYRFVSVTEIYERDAKLTTVRTRCRTIGVLHSTNGQYCLKNMDLNDRNTYCEILVSLEGLAELPRPAIVPYTAQIFGFLDHANGSPIIYATVVQVLPHKIACKLNDIMKLVCAKHLATPVHESNDSEELCKMLENKL